MGQYRDNGKGKRNYGDYKGFIGSSTGTMAKGIWDIWNPAILSEHNIPGFARSLPEEHLASASGSVWARKAGTARSFTGVI